MSRISPLVYRCLSPFVKFHQGTNHATALRGLAALSVVLIHYDGFGTRESLPKGSFPYDAWNSFINLGIYGPTVFLSHQGLH
jgi:peptidoglycan/LPS O-acetylase OafA/YrhL